MKLKDIMPLTNEQQSTISPNKIATKTVRKNITNSKLEPESQKILDVYHQVILSGYKNIKSDELEFLKIIIFRIENDPKYVPSASVASFAKLLLM